MAGENISSFSKYTLKESTKKKNIHLKIIKICIKKQHIAVKMHYTQKKITEIEIVTKLL